MSQHPNAKTIGRMTRAVFEQDREALLGIFTEDLHFHMRGPVPVAGDHRGLDGFLGALGSMFELTAGDITLDQRFCSADEHWGAEWEHATLGRNGKTLESDNSFVYRFDAGRIAEMWMFIGAPPDQAAAFLA